jgi:hypothetical protein
MILHLGGKQDHLSPSSWMRTLEAKSSSSLLIVVALPESVRYPYRYDMSNRLQ